MAVLLAAHVTAPDVADPCGSGQPSGQFDNIPVEIGRPCLQRDARRRTIHLDEEIVRVEMLEVGGHHLRGEIARRPERSATPRRSVRGHPDAEVRDVFD